MNGRDLRDGVIENQAFDLVIAAERIASLEADVAVYQEVLRAALEAVRDLTVTHDALRAGHERVVQDYRRLREECLIAAGALGDAA